ncbi:hypothetical protein HN511_02460 [bacterium]|jgi:hypothetical protein|nr:hypothetical protein [bacterium]
MEKIFTRLERFPSQFLKELDVVYRDCKHVTNISSWDTRLDQLTSALAKKKGTYRQVEDHIFELKIINHLLKSFPDCVITYEPKGVIQDGKKCDLEINYQDKRYLVEAKCFHPEWEKAKIPKQHIAKNNTVIMPGELYHAYQATRGHLVAETRDTEQKFTNYDGKFISVLAIPEGFHLDIEDFRDFVFIYREGKPRTDDPLGPMTMHNLGGPFEGTIDQFWTFPFLQENFLLEANKKIKIIDPLMHLDKNLEL